MKIRTTALAVTVATSFVIAGAFADAATAASLTPTTTTVTAQNPIGTRPGKLVIAAKVRPTSGTVVPTGSCSVVIDASPAIIKTLNTKGRCSVTTHVTLGAHTISVTYSGSTSMDTSVGSATITVTQ